jgi:hypothetical protein
VTATPGRRKGERRALAAGLNELLRMWLVSKRVNVSDQGDDDPSLIEANEDEAIAGARAQTGRRVFSPRSGEDT